MDAPAYSLGNRWLLCWYKELSRSPAGTCAVFGGGKCGDGTIAVGMEENFTARAPRFSWVHH
jgi:hypothetical protein